MVDIIRLSLDLSKEYLEEFMGAISNIKSSHFDGIEICLWEDMREHANTIKDSLLKYDLSPNVHNDLMRSKYGSEHNKGLLYKSLEFYKLINANLFVTHPIKPYKTTLIESRNLFNSFENIAIETVQDIRIPEIEFFDRPIVVDIGSIIKNGEIKNLATYANIQTVKEVHIHDTINGKDHETLSTGVVNLDEIIEVFGKIDYTIELGSEFRKWDDLKPKYIKSIDILNNAIIKNYSYGKNIRLQHLKKFISETKFTKVTEFGCGDGYLVNNVNSEYKVGIDITPKKIFNNISYKTADITNVIEFDNDFIICSEVIEHVFDDISAIKNMYRSLNTHGILFLTTLNSNTDKDKSVQDKIYGHHRRYDASLKNILEYIGFSTLQFYPIRSKHYYEHRDSIDNYSIQADIKDGTKYASGWVYIGIKK